jgi:ketosteroid isomerase-like protein
MANDNLSSVKTFLTEFSSGSMNKALTVLTDDAKWSIVQVARGVTISKSQLAERITAMRASFKDNSMVLKVVGVIENGDRLSVELESFATTVLGKTYANKYCLVFTMSGGKIADVREYNDSMHVLEILLPAIEHTRTRA